MIPKSNPNTINVWFDCSNIPTLNICGIYQILSLATGKRYIGSSKNASQRWRSHLKDLKLNRHHSMRLQEEYNIYGIDNFRFNILEFCQPQEKLEKEKLWMTHFTSTEPDFGFNILSEPACAARKLTAKDVKEIKEILGKGIKNLRLAEKFGVSDAAIASIKYVKS